MELKSQLLQALNQGIEIRVTWDGGGDEEFFHLFINGEEEEEDNEFSRILDEYLVKYSPISGVGEIVLEGGGEIIIEDGKVVLNYISTISLAEDYDESGEPIISEEKSFTEKDKFILFEI